jgi:protein-S-isoprenylcysteine O-methyltransferase Ste14
MTLDQIIRFFLPIYTFFYLVIFGAKYRGFKGKYRKSAFVVKKNDRLPFTLELYKLVLAGIIIVAVVVYAFFPKYYTITVPVDYLDIAALKIAGLCILALSLILSRTGESQMKDAWRIGVDQEEKKIRLVTSGIYKYSRNPIALGMILTLAGYFLIIPNALTLLTLFSGYMIAQLRIIVEEEYLKTNLGHEYGDYCKKTRKWL